jgi:phosphinothricin acetyltransferase
LFSAAEVRHNSAMTIAVRNVTPADIPAITRIYRQAVLEGTATFEIDPPDEAQMTERMKSLVSGGFLYIVAAEGGTILGYAYAGPYRLRPAYRFTVEDSIYIAPSAHRRGIGRLLLVELIAQSTQRGFRQMVAVIGDSENRGSVGLHAALGFKMTGTFDDVGFKFGRWLDSVLMQLALGEGATTKPEL